MNEAIYYTGRNYKMTNVLITQKQWALSRAAVLQKALKLVITGILMLTCFYTTGYARDKKTVDNSSSSDRWIQDTFPVPKGNPLQLFYLQRTPNSNTVVYELNVKPNGTLDEDEPVKVYWIRYPEGGIKKDLNFIQRKYAYGVSAVRTTDGRYKLTFAAYKKKNLYLAFAPRDNKYHIYTSFGDKVVILSKVFIMIKPGGTFWSPNVEYLELKGNEPGQSQDLYERIMIGKD